jgi:hypothetical protein
VPRAFYGIAVGIAVHFTQNARSRICIQASIRGRFRWHSGSNICTFFFSLTLFINNYVFFKNQLATVCPVICYPFDLRLLYSATLLNDTTIACVKADRIIEILPFLKGEDGNSSQMYSSNRCCIPSQILIWCKGDHLVDWIVIYTCSQFLN